MSEQEIKSLINTLEDEFKFDTSDFKEKFTLPREERKSIYTWFFNQIFLRRKRKKEIQIKDLLVMMNRNKLL
jgi:hypothetical protein